MLEYKNARELFDRIKVGVEKTSQEELKKLFREFIFDTLVYANTLTVWSQMGEQERILYQEKKKDEYLGFAVSLLSICLDLNIDEFDDILPDEETQSDFACYIQLFVSLSHRNKF